MRALYISVLCLQCVAHFVSASVLRQRHGTVAERHAQLPDVGLSNRPPPKDITLDSPESIKNVGNYQVAMPTPLPAAFNGVYCHGSSCQYRVPAPLPTTPPPLTPPPLPIGGNMNSGREFCRGLSCIDGMGVPGSPELAAFQVNCVHLFQDVGGGLRGTDLDRTVTQVFQSFEDVCRKRVGVLEVGACPAYANTFLGVLTPKVRQTSVGGTVEVCNDLYWWLVGFKQAEIDLKLTAAALPKGSSLLAADLNRFGSGGIGPNSPRGIKWRQWAWSHGMKQTPPAVAKQLTDDGAIAASLFLQVRDPPLAPKPLLPGEDTPEDSPRGLPKYNQNPPCDIKDKHVVRQKGTKYQIAPGSADGAIPPVEVAGDLFTYCSKQMSEIMMGFSQTARETVKMTKSWCSWQASISSWVGQKEEFGHPDWTHRTCSGMEFLVAFSLKDQLRDYKTGLSAQAVCKKIFLSIGAVHRTEGIFKEAWETSLRGAPTSGIPAADDSQMQKLLKEAQQYANNIFNKLRGQKTAFEKLNNAKMDTSSFDQNSVELSPPPATPDLPDSTDLDPTALLAVSVERVKQSRHVGMMTVDSLKPWGSGA